MGILILDFHFSTAHRFLCLALGLVGEMKDSSELWKCGNLAPLARFPRAVGSVGSLLLACHAFHSPAISTALRSDSLRHRRGGKGDSSLQRRSSFALASVILLAYWVSLSNRAVPSSCSKQIPAFRYCAAWGSDFSFS